MRGEPVTHVRGEPVTHVELEKVKIQNSHQLADCSAMNLWRQSVFLDHNLHMTLCIYLAISAYLVSGDKLRARNLCSQGLLIVDVLDNVLKPDICHGLI